MQHPTPLIMLAIDALVVAVRPAAAEDRCRHSPSDRPAARPLPALAADADDVAEDLEYERWDGLA